jgi:hypothetical protein
VHQQLGVVMVDMVGMEDTAHKSHSHREEAVVDSAQEAHSHQILGSAQAAVVDSAQAAVVDSAQAAEEDSELEEMADLEEDSAQEEAEVVSKHRKSLWNLIITQSSFNFKVAEYKYTNTSTSMWHLKKMTDQQEQDQEQDHLAQLKNITKSSSSRLHLIHNKLPNNKLPLLLLLSMKRLWSTYWARDPMIFLLLDQDKLMHPHSHQANQKFTSSSTRLKPVLLLEDHRADMAEQEDLEPEAVVLDLEAEMVVEPVLIQDPVVLHLEDTHQVTHQDTHHQVLAPHLPTMEHPDNLVHIRLSKSYSKTDRLQNAHGFMYSTTLLLYVTLKCFPGIFSFYE